VDPGVGSALPRRGKGRRRNRNSDYSPEIPGFITYGQVARVLLSQSLNHFRYYGLRIAMALKTEIAEEERLIVPIFLL
jgi:hypothetical protein